MMLDSTVQNDSCSRLAALLLPPVSVFCVIFTHASGVDACGSDGSKVTQLL